MNIFSRFSQLFTVQQLPYTKNNFVPNLNCGCDDLKELITKLDSTFQSVLMFSIFNHLSRFDVLLPCS